MAIVCWLSTVGVFFALAILRRAEAHPVALGLVAHPLYATGESPSDLRLFYGGGFG
ncbi:MAG: hypothetical protein ACUVX8_02195 [Candidatus Zipacnadales bacterium]